MDNTNVDVVSTDEVPATEEKKVITPSDYKVIMNLIKETEDSYNTLKSSIYDSVTTMGYDNHIINDLLPYKKEDIPNMSDDDIKNFLKEYRIIDEEPDVEDMKKLKDFSIILLQTQFETEKAKNETYSVLADYFNYLSSDQVKKSRLERLEALKEAVETETNEVRKSKMLSMISAMESALSFDFIKKRFNELGEDEIDNVMDGFFNKKKGSYIVEKYVKKIKRFGYEPSIYQKFFNIEENFLNEKYSPFNNLFLYIYMKFVGYSDPYNESDKMFVQSLTSAIANLIYHKFESIEAEQQFISVITDVVSRFESHEEFFKENNSTYENHPDRVAATKEYEERRREALLKALEKLHVENIDENLSTDELQKIYEDKTEELVTEQIDTKKDEDAEESDDSEVEDTDEVIDIEYPDDTQDITAENE